MKKKCYEKPSASVIDLLNASVLMVSNGNTIITDFEYDGNPWL